MPITRQQFETGINESLLNAMRRVHRFLSENKDKAFTESEIIAVATEGGDVNVTNHLHAGPIVEATRYHDRAYSPAVSKLVEIGAVEARRVRGTLYFTYRRDLTE